MQTAILIHNRTLLECCRPINQLASKFPTPLNLNFSEFVNSLALLFPSPHSSSVVLLYHDQNVLEIHVLRNHKNVWIASKSKNM